MTWALHPKLKKFLVISLKNAVNAFLINGSLMAQWHDIFNLNNWAGVWAIARVTLGVIGTREFMVWGPKLWKWSQTDADADLLSQGSQDVTEEDVTSFNNRVRK
jgi:hypothetical protein